MKRFKKGSTCVWSFKSLRWEIHKVDGLSIETIAIQAEKLSSFITRTIISQRYQLVCPANEMSAHSEIELIPGTEILLSADEGYGRHSSNKENLVLVPTPSDQPDDPLVTISCHLDVHTR